MGNPNSKKGGGGGDMTLESRHLMGIFVGLVVLCTVFFALGYAMGRTQFDTTVNAATLGKPVSPVTPESSPLATAPAKASPAPAPADWTYHTATEAKKPADRLEPPPSKSSPRDMKVELNPAPAKRQPEKPEPAAVASTRNVAPKSKSPAIPKGSVVLQVAALSKEADAYALASALQQKGFASFVVQPLGDNLYRVQVGPYPDSASADGGKKALLREGFKAILKK